MEDGAGFRFGGLDEFFSDLAYRYEKDYEYTVAWIDAWRVAKHGAAGLYYG